MSDTQDTCKHRNRDRAHRGIAWCYDCNEQVMIPRRAIQHGRQWTVNGYQLDDWEYEMVRQARARRDRAIEDAKRQYQQTFDELVSNRRRNMTLPYPSGGESQLPTDGG